MKIQVTQSSLPPYEEYINEIKDVWDSKWLTNMGVKHKKLEKELLDYLDATNITLFTNGHLALESAIEAFDLRGEVITTPFTFASTTHAIVRQGLTPVFCDINLDDYTMDVNLIEDLITEKTSAILPVHVYGNVCDVDTIEKLANKYNLKVIYDAAHAFGVEVNGKGIGNYGHASMFSFHATKVFNTIEGGCVTYNDNELTKKLNLIKNFGVSGPESVELIGTNAKMNEFQAAMGICNLRYLDENIEKRKKIVEKYDELLDGLPGIQLLKSQGNVCSNYAYYPVVFDEYKKLRDQVYEELLDENIVARKYFYPLITDMEPYRKIYNSGLTPLAKDIAEKVLCLPIYPDLALSVVEEICKKIKS